LQVAFFSSEVSLLSVDLGLGGGGFPFAKSSPLCFHGGCPLSLEETFYLGDRTPFSRCDFLPIPFYSPCSSSCMTYTFPTKKEFELSGFPPTGHYPSGPPPRQLQLSVACERLQRRIDSPSAGSPFVCFSSSFFCSQ